MITHIPWYHCRTLQFVEIVEYSPLRCDEPLDVERDNNRYRILITPNYSSGCHDGSHISGVGLANNVMVAK